MGAGADLDGAPDGGDPDIDIGTNEDGNLDVDVSTDGSDGPFVDLEISVDSGGSTNAWKSGFAIEPDASEAPSRVD